MKESHLNISLNYKIEVLNNMYVVKKTSLIFP